MRRVIQKVTNYRHCCCSPSFDETFKNVCSLYLQHVNMIFTVSLLLNVTGITEERQREITIKGSPVITVFLFLLSYKNTTSSGLKTIKC